MNHLVAGFDRPIRNSGRADADAGDDRSGWEHPLEDLDDEFSAPARS
jgi:hypothetical protein